MSRPLRLDLAGAIHHVLARGNAREPIYRDGNDRASWNDILAETVERFGWLVLAYCQMGNHFHLLIETPRPNLSRGMRHLNGAYAQLFNRRHARVGHVFEGRFRALLVERDEHLLSVASYIPRNPVRAGLCGEPAVWRWSSYRATIGLEPPGFVAVDALLAFFAEERGRARARYRAFVDDHVDEAGHEPPLFLGSDAFARAHTRRLEPIPEVPRAHWQPVRSPLADVLSMRTNAAIAAAYREYGYTMREIADYLGVHYATISRRIRRYEMLECKT